MMKEAIGKGATYEKAVDDALVKLGVTREQVEIEPLREASPGFLGFGKKPAEVRAVLRGDHKTYAANYMQGILRHLGIETDMKVELDEDESIHIYLGEEASPLIGHRGQTLDALQYLVSRYLNEDKDDWAKVVIDIDNYRDKREELLKNLALKLAGQVAKNKRDAKTEPLTAPERRVIHMALKDDTKVTTFSIGEGNRKRVVIASTERPPSQRRSRGGKGRGRSQQGGGQRPEGARSGSSRGGGGRGRRRGGNRQKQTASSPPSSK